MVGVFVAFIRVVYGRKIYMSLPTAICVQTIHRERSVRATKLLAHPTSISWGRRFESCFPSIK